MTTLSTLPFPTNTESQRSIVKLVTKSPPIRQRSSWYLNTRTFLATKEQPEHCRDLFCSLIYKETKFLDKYNPSFTMRKLYIVYGIETPVFCAHCGKHDLIRRKIRIEAYLNRGYILCSNRCISSYTGTKIIKIATSMKNFGVPHPMQDQEVFERTQASAYRKNKSITIDGTVFSSLSGYEDSALRFISENSIPVNRINPNPKITIRYTKSDGTSHVYFPDIQIYSIDKRPDIICEVKSTFTVGIESSKPFNEPKYKTIKRKARSVLELGYRFVLMVGIGSIPKHGTCKTFLCFWGKLPSSKNLVRLINKAQVSANISSSSTVLQ